MFETKSAKGNSKAVRNCYNLFFICSFLFIAVFFIDIAFSNIKFNSFVYSCNGNIFITLLIANIFLGVLNIVDKSKNSIERMAIVVLMFCQLSILSSLVIAGGLM